MGKYNLIKDKFNVLNKGKSSKAAIKSQNSIEK